MTRAQPRSILTMKILIELDQIFPVGIVMKLLGAPIYRALPVLIAKEDIGQPSIDLERNLEQRHQISRTGWALDFKIVSVELIKLIERPQNKAIHRHPDQSAPVGVAAEHPCI